MPSYVLTTQTKRYMEDHALKVAYDLMMDGNAPARERLSACRMIMAEGGLTEESQTKVNQLFDSIKGGQGTETERG